MKRRIRDIQEHDETKGNQYSGEPKERNRMREAREDDLTCKICGKICKSKGGLTNHKRLIHEKEGKKLFKCEECEETFTREANLVNHKKVCNKLKNDMSGSKQCECGKRITKANWARHRKKCTNGGNDEREREPARVYKQGWKNCEKCDKLISKTNMSRHLKSCRTEVS